MIDILPKDRDLALIATDVQQAAKTTAFYVVGQLFYSDNNYDSGHKAMDSAMKSLAGNASEAIENKSLVEFLKGRLSFSEGKFVDAIPHYVSSITADPQNAAAYNNLAIVYAKLEGLTWHEEDPVASNTRKELNRVEAQLIDAIQKSPLSALQSKPPSELLDPAELFKKARKIDPSSVYIHYNEIASAWKRVHTCRSYMVMKRIIPTTIRPIWRRTHRH